MTNISRIREAAYNNDTLELLRILEEEHHNKEDIAYLTALKRLKGICRTQKQVREAFALYRKVHPKKPMLFARPLLDKWIHFSHVDFYKNTCRYLHFKVAARHYNKGCIDGLNRLIDKMDNVVYARASKETSSWTGRAFRVFIVDWDKGKSIVVRIHSSYSDVLYRDTETGIELEVDLGSYLNGKKVRNLRIGYDNPIHLNMDVIMSMAKLLNEELGLDLYWYLQNQIRYLSEREDVFRWHLSRAKKPNWDELINE